MSNRLYSRQHAGDSVSRFDSYVERAYHQTRWDKLKMGAALTGIAPVLIIAAPIALFYIGMTYARNIRTKKSEQDMRENRKSPSNLISLL